MPTAGLMDTSFGGGDGVALFGGVPNFSSPLARSVVVQPDGKTVLAGSIGSQIGNHALIFRMNVDGSLDTSFSGDGYYTSQFTGSQTYFLGLAIQPDGKLVATGSVRNGNTMVLTARFNTDGSLDTSFDVDGYTTTDFTAGDENGYAIAVAPDGKIAVVGDGPGLVVIRYTSTGALDTSFSLDGIFSHQPGGYGAWGRGVAIQPDGKIIGAGGGVEAGSPNKRLMLIRLNLNGTLDSSFDTDGIVTTSVPGAGETGGYDVVVLPDGRLTAVGSGLVGSSGQHFVARYLPSGSLDNSFDQDGRILFDLDGISGGELHGVAVQEDGKVVAAGSAAFPNDALLMRFDEDGMDDDFGVGNFRLAPGVVFTNVDDDNSWDVALAPNGRIVTSGKAGGFASVLRYTGDIYAVPDNYVSNEAAQLTVNAPGVLANDPTPNASPRVVTLVTDPQHEASFALNADGSFSYEPLADYFGPDSFTYYFTAGTVVSTTTTVTITVAPTNDLPTANDDDYDLPRITPLQLVVPAQQGLLANDTDPDGDALHAILVAPPSIGTLDLNDDGSFTYDFPANFSGSTTFTYKVNDGTVDGSTATVTLTRPVNQVPTADDDSYQLPRLSPLQLSVSSALGVLSNDNDVEGDTLHAILVAPPSTGTLTLNDNGSFTYVFPANFNGSTTFTYKVNDGTVDGNTATVTLTRPNNQAPTADDDSYIYPFNPPFNLVAPGVLLNDSDPENDAFTAELLSQPATGTVNLQPNGSFTYQYPTGFAGPVTFTYRVTDGRATSNTATVTLTRAANQPPVAVNDEYELPLAGTYTQNALGGVLSNDSDTEGNGIVATLLTSPAVGDLVFNSDGSFSYAFPSDLAGSVLFTYQVADAFATGNIASVTLTRQNLIGAQGESLVIVGSEFAESIRVRPVGKGILVESYTDSGIVRETVFPIAPIKRFKTIEVFLGAGDDRLDTTAWALSTNIVDGTGNDVIRTGKGNDTIHTDVGSGWGSSSKFIFTGAGNDVVVAGDGSNTIDTGKGNDRVTLGHGSNEVITGVGDDTVIAGDGGNYIDAGAGNDVVTTGSGNDWLLGGAGRDVLDAGDGHDIVNGGTGNDLLVGGMGMDLLEGMAGSDILIDGMITVTDPINDSLVRILKNFVPSSKTKLIALLPRFTVTYDTLDIDTLLGGSGKDWFWSGNVDDEWDRTGIEPLNGTI